ncbi:putative Pol protein, partial [Daphnia magna]
PDSYRPISLTSCLGKIMEKIINRRLVWMFEKNRMRLRNQLGFRKGRGTMDNIIALEHFIREGFNKIQPQNTYAVFLDIEKAFDTTWIQGLLYKLCNKGVTGEILGWLTNLLRNRKYSVRVGNKFSKARPLRVGVPQGSP